MLNAWKRLISDPDYDPVLSELVAVLSFLGFWVAFLFLLLVAGALTLGAFLLNPLAGVVIGYLSLVFLALAWIAMRRELLPARKPE